MTLPSTSLVRTLLSDVQVRNTYPLSSLPTCKDIDHEPIAHQAGLLVLSPKEPSNLERAESQANWASMEHAACMAKTSRLAKSRL